MYKLIQKTIDLGEGREITIETGKLAKQADGSVVVKMGRTMLLATVVSAKEAREDVDFMPLSVEYKEKYASPFTTASQDPFITDIIEPGETRRCLIKAFKLMQGKKKVNKYPKKHGNIPL